MSGNVVRILARIGDGPGAVVREFRGRRAWALNELLQAGPVGVTTLQRPAPRWSDYIMKLRREGVGIHTEHEGHGGDFAGHHGRYRLTVPVSVIEVETAGA